MKELPSVFLVVGHFLVVKPDSALKASGICTFRITSPMVLSSSPLCQVRLARFQPEPRKGNLSVSVKLSESGATHSLAFVSKEQDGVGLVSFNDLFTALD